MWGACAITKEGTGRVNRDDKKAKQKITGIIGVTDDGSHIVTGEYTCPFWEEGASGVFLMRECWYRYVDFRKSSRVTLQKSICRNPRCRVAADEIPQRAKKEQDYLCKQNEKARL